MSLLPSRPYKIRFIFIIKYLLGSGIFALAAIALALYSPYWIWTDEIGQLKRDQHVWNTGLIASSGSVGGQERSNQFILYSYDLKVSYLDVFGQPHRGECSFSLFWTQLETNAPAAIRYNPDHPDEFVLSWEVEHMGARWGAVGLLAFGMILITACLGGLAFGMSRKLRLVHRVSKQSDEILLDVLSRRDQIVNGTRTGSVLYSLKRPDIEGNAGHIEHIMPKGEFPLFADAAEQKIFALVSPDAPKGIWIVRRDFHPFDFTTEEIVNIRERIQSASPASFRAAK